MVWRLWRRCYLTCVRIFNDVEDKGKSWDLAHEGPGALGQDEDPLAEAKDTEDATSTRGPSELAAPLVSETTASAAVRCGQEVVVRVQDRSDIVSDLKPATCRPRHGESQSNSELVGPLATVPLRPTVVEEALAWRGQLEDRS